MKRAILGIFALLIIALPAFAQAASATSPTKRPTVVIEPSGCVTDQCHSGIKQSKVMHGPVASNDCGSCHELADAAAHTFTMPRRDAEMCTYCHEFSVKQMPVVHKPVAQGQCLGCHDPHGGATRALSREATTPELCGRCHQSITGKRSFVHGPVEQGACESCHPPHASKFPKLLDVVGPDLCFACHTNFQPAVAGAKFHHKAMEEGCTKCHDVHASDAPMSLVKSVPALCNDCHDKLAAAIASSTVKHSTVSDGRSCMNCHAAHASNISRLMDDTPAALCVKCHDKPNKSADGRTIAAIAEVVDPKLHKHGEIKDGLCSGCHQVHGGANELLLIRPYSRALYQEFSAENYAFCFTCHNAQLATEKLTASSTGFRNGRTNLHFVHANQGNRDRNCRACHVPHAAGNTRLIRERMTYGQRELLMRFEKTATGGACSPSCHAPWPYDREHPFPATMSTTTTTAPAATTASTIAATRPTTARTDIAGSAPQALSHAPLAAGYAERSDATVVRWMATDIAGALISIPSGRPTAIILLAADDPGREKITAELLQLQAARNASVTVVLSGAGARERAAELTQKTKASVIADPQHEIAASLNVRGWPTVLILRPDGMEVARISGDAAFLTSKVAANLETFSTPATQQTKASAVREEISVKVARDLKIARQLLAQGKPREALEYLQHNTEGRSASAEIELVRGRALVQLRQTNAAEAVLFQIAETPTNAQELRLAKASLYIAQDQWYLARTLLEDYIRRFDADPEGHLMLGRAYEHDQDWPKAAEQYRLAAERRAPPR